MRKLFALCAAAMVTIPSTLSAETMPRDVVFTDTGAVAESLTGVPGDPEAGFKAATTKSLGNCVACHVAEGWKDLPLPGNIGPELTGVATRWEEADLRGILTNAKHTFPESFMPAFYNLDNIIRPGDAYTGKAAKSLDVTILSAQQVEDILALLLTFNEE